MPKASGEEEAKARPPLGKFRTSVTIIQGRNLLPLHLSSSDPYIQLTIGDVIQQTEKKMRTLNPVWNYRIDFAQGVQPNELFLECFDWNLMRSRGRMGAYLVDLEPFWEGSCPTVQWMLLALDGKSAGEIQVQIDCTTETTEQSSSGYTHLLELTLMNAKDLSFGFNASCEVEWGGNCHFYTEQSLTNEWNQTIFLWVDARTHANNKIALTVRTDARKCYTYLGLYDVLTQHDYEYRWLDLRPMLPRTDAELAKENVSLEKPAIDTGSGCGQLRVMVVVRTSDQVEAELLGELINEFADDAEEFDHSAVSLMMQSAGISMTETLVDLLELRARDRINRQQLFAFMQATEVQTSGELSKLLYYAKSKDAYGSLLSMAAAASGHKVQTKHIVVKDLATGLLVYEAIPAYIRAALQLMSSSKVTRLVTAHSKGLMTNLSKRQGVKYDDPASVKAIPGFIKLHGLDMSEAEHKLEDYRCFNDFFSRTLKRSARPVDEPQNPHRAVSPADCRMMVFRDITESTKKWIKGKQFTLENLLGEAGKMYVDLLQGGALVTCRLAPQDYHRWHVPVKGVLGPTIPIAGKLYTVNPIAVNNRVSVFTKNKRVLVPIFSAEFGVVMLIAVGAVMVGSICIDGKEGDEVQKGDRHGYFKFGGSTVLLIFEKDRIQFRQELLDNSRDHLETLIKCGQFLGTAIPQKVPSSPKARSSRSRKSQTLDGALID